MADLGATTCELVRRFASKLLKLVLRFLNMTADVHRLLKRESGTLVRQAFPDMTRSTFEMLISDDAVDSVTEVARRRKLPQAGCVGFERLTRRLTSLSEPVTVYEPIVAVAKWATNTVIADWNSSSLPWGGFSLEGGWLSRAWRWCKTLAVFRHPGHLAEWLFVDLVSSCRHRQIQGNSALKGCRLKYFGPSTESGVYSATCHHIPP